MPQTQDEDEVRAEIARLVEAGKLTACTPFDGMDEPWTEEEKTCFQSALAELFGWKDEK